MFSTDFCAFVVDIILRQSKLAVRLVTFMAQSPIIKTLNEMLAKLKDATETYREAEKAVNEYSTAIRALAQVCEDEDIKATYLLALEEVSGKQGFVDAIRSVLKRGAALTPTDIRQMIVLTGKMSLSGYSNPMASIHTTLRRMKERGEVEEIESAQGEKAYALKEFKRGDLAKAFAKK